ALELRRVELDHGARMGAVGLAGVLVDVERQFHARRARWRPHRIDPRGKLWREWRDQSGHRAKRGGAGIEREFSDRIDAVEAAGALQRHTVGLADPELFQRQRFRRVAKFDKQRPQLLAGRNGATYIERKLPFV